MQRKPFTIRLGDNELAALQAAAAEDQRPAAMLARKLLIEGLARMGHPVAPEKPRSEKVRGTKGRAKR